MLVINPGSTSTKVALYKGYDLIKEQTLRHDVKELDKYFKIYPQKDFRKNIIVDFLMQNNVKVEDIDVFVGRGGMLRPLKGGTYLVNEAMVADLAEEKYGSHASNLGAIIAFELAAPQNKEAYIVDPVCVDEFEDISRVTGLKGIIRKSLFHALNQKAIAKRYANDIGVPYDKLNLIVAHLGGGISVGLHRQGRVIDVNNALDGDGPFSPERTGSLPAVAVAELAIKNNYTLDEMKKIIAGKGGLVSHLGTSSGMEITTRIKQGDSDAKFYLQAMAYQITKEIGSLYFVMGGKIDAILITGGLAHNTDLVSMLKWYTDPIMILSIYPGEDEMKSLAEGTMRVLEKTEEVKYY
jgi:butyrate kinase